MPTVIKVLAGFNSAVAIGAIVLLVLLICKPLHVVKKADKSETESDSADVKSDENLTALNEEKPCEEVEKENCDSESDKEVASAEDSEREDVAEEAAENAADLEEDSSDETEDDEEDEDSEEASNEEGENTIAKGFDFSLLSAAKRRSFADKMADLPLETREYLDKIDNEFRSYKGVNARISGAGISYRVGRKLISKLKVRGRTLTLYLALDVNEFKQTVYFQKDSSDKKAYASVPFTVKIRSARAFNNVLKLISAVAEKESLAKNPRYKQVNSVELIKQKLGK